MSIQTSSSLGGRDLVLTDADFNRICQLIYERAGIVLADNKREMVYSRLAKRLRLHGISHFGDYLDRLARQPAAREWEAFTNALTTNLTAFFREAHHFPLLAQHIAGRNEPVRVWCAAASTGEEPYSIAMTLLETLPSSVASLSQVVATDIDTEALSKAKMGIYPLKQVLEVGEERARRFFLRGSGDRVGLARIRPEVAKLVDFRQLNLHSPRWDINGPFDVIFCRNIMIYFDKPSQTQILKRFVSYIKPDGLLITGHSENFTYLTEDFKLRGQTVYTLAASARS
ncbi:CheR family methyltransferase [Pseudomonas sp. NW5]|uniref:CheR family methyltransferase n=1 Tax=Pseudomonas sp. NW5 TaxID=2934934 RepID=UPI00202268D0|nr:CheR family methyltransferase [Pseudomonas sp. NW5]MCL7461889.1 chemotaxis protein CheR [Pseudomonas sp. NW5]